MKAIYRTVVGNYTLEEWCYAAGVWWREDFPEEGVPLRLVSLWKKGEDPADHRKMLETWKGYRLVDREGTHYAIVDIRRAAFYEAAVLVSYSGPVKVRTVSLYLSKMSGNYTIAKASRGSRENPEWTIYKMGERVSELPPRPLSVSVRTDEDRDLAHLHEAVVKGFSMEHQRAPTSDAGGDLQVKAGRVTDIPAPVEQGGVFERIHKVVCPKCGDLDKFYLVVQAELQVNAALAPAEGLISWSCTGVVNKETVVPTRFQCKGCRHEWPIPEALLSSVVRR